MKILGINGLNHSMAYKSQLLDEGTDKRFFRICQGMDSAAAILVDGKVVAAVEEERLNRQKHSNLLPVEAMKFCLDQANLKLSDLDGIAFGFNYSKQKNFYTIMPGGKGWYDHVYAPEVLKQDLQRAFGEDFPVEKLSFIDHHLAHAASCYYPSGFEESLIIVADGMGEMKGISIYNGTGSKIELIHEINFNHSLGIFYSLITFHLGFDFNADEYKTMGLAPYGDPNKYLPKLLEWIHFDDENGTFSFSYMQKEPEQQDRETYEKTRAFLEQELFKARDEDEPVEQYHMDLAAALQALTNKVMCFLAEYWMKKCKTDHLCMAGGVALNCVANEHVLKLPCVKNIFIQPAAGDDGTSLGAAMMMAAQKDKIEKQGLPYYGPDYIEADVVKAFQGFSKDGMSKCQHKDIDAAAKRAAELIAEGKVLSLYQGRMEFGPRALGNRSILADPRDPEMRDRVNAAVKMREGFRPFAPVVLEDKMHDIFEVERDDAYRYMLVTLPVKEAYRDQLPAITHVDGSARLQTISCEENPLYYKIIQYFYELTQIPVLLNTSFNVKGQVIVHTPQEAIDTFWNTGIDSVFLGCYEMSKG